MTDFSAILIHGDDIITVDPNLIKLRTVDDKYELMKLMNSDMKDNIITIELNQYDKKSFNNLKSYIEMINVDNDKFTMDDLILCNFIGYDKYMDDLLDILTKKDITFTLYDFIVEHTMVHKYMNIVLKYLRNITYKDINYIDMLLEIGLSVKDEYKDTTNDKHLKRYIDVINKKDIYYMINNYVFSNHLEDSYIYYQLLDRAIKIGGVDILEIVTTKMKISICKNIYELYKKTPHFELLTEIILFNGPSKNKCKGNCSFLNFPIYLNYPDKDKEYKELIYSRITGYLGATDRIGNGNFNFAVGNETSDESTNLKINKCTTCRSIFSQI